MIRVYASGDPFAGELMKGRLEAEDIPVMLKGEGEGSYRTGAVYLWVPQEFETQARTVIAAVESGAFALDENTDTSKAVAEEQAAD